MPKPGVKPGELHRITQAMRRTLSGTVTLPNVDTEVTHDLGSVPTFVYLTPLTTGVAGYPSLTARTITSIVIKGSVSGVNVEYKVEA